VKIALLRRFNEGPATHLGLVFIACRRYETKHDFAGPPIALYNRDYVMLQYAYQVERLLSKFEVAGTHRLSRMSASFCSRQVDQ
jgi:hypothetical protein